MLYIREWRAHAGIESQIALAELSGIPQGQLSDLERNLVPNPGITTLRRVLAGLNQRLPTPIRLEDLLAPPPPALAPTPAPEADHAGA